jgi:hypothetical protein
MSRVQNQVACRKKTAPTETLKEENTTGFKMSVESQALDGSSL